MKKKLSVFRTVQAFAWVLVLSVLVTMLSGCALTDFLFGNEEGTTVDPGTTAVPASTTAPEGSGTVSDVTTADPAITTEVPADGTTGVPEVTTAPEQPEVVYVDPMTGLPALKDYSRIRPVSLVIDNTSLAYPQSGLSAADIVVEVPVEGGITRLILITNKYEDQNYVYGPIRSTRDYMVGICQAFGTLMVGAGGSPTGYEVISANQLEYIDGVNDSLARSFFRSDERKTKSGYEHSLMITANGIRANASAHNYSLAQAAGWQAMPFADDAGMNVLSFAFAEKGQDAVRTVITYSSYQQAQLVYSAQNNAYFRYEFGTKPHYDAEDGNQLRFENVFILYTEQKPIAGDTEGRLNVQTTGTGEGVYLYGGKYINIKWFRDAFTSAFVFTDENGNALSVAPGKSMITLVDAAKKGTDNVILNLTAEADN